MWKNNSPGPSNLEQHPPASPPDDEIPNMPDINLEDNLLGLEDDLANPGGPSQITDLKMRCALNNLGISI